MFFSTLVMPFVLVVAGFPLGWLVEVWVWARIPGSEEYAERLFEAGFVGSVAGMLTYLAFALTAPIPRPDLVLAEAVPNLFPAVGYGLAAFWALWLLSRLSWLVRTGTPVGANRGRILGLLAGFLAMVAVWWARRTPPGPDFSGWFAP